MTILAYMVFAYMAKRNGGDCAADLVYPGNLPMNPQAPDKWDRKLEAESEEDT